MGDVPSHTRGVHVRINLITPPKNALDQLRLLPANFQARRAAEVLEHRAVVAEIVGAEVQVPFH